MFHNVSPNIASKWQEWVIRFLQKVAISSSSTLLEVSHWQMPTAPLVAPKCQKRSWFAREKVASKTASCDAAATLKKGDPKWCFQPINHHKPHLYFVHTKLNCFVHQIFLNTGFSPRPNLEKGGLFRWLVRSRKAWIWSNVTLAYQSPIHNMVSARTNPVLDWIPYAAKATLLEIVDAVEISPMESGEVRIHPLAPASPPDIRTYLHLWYA